MTMRVLWSLNSSLGVAFNVIQ